MSKPLAGIRVVDCTAVLSGPLATAMLADQGADVIKIESAGGDTTRSIGPTKGPMSSIFIATNRGKRGITLDLKNPEAVRVVHDLIRTADVFAENYRPGVADRLGLGWAALSAINPRLVYLSISGFGPDGPDAGVRVYDGVVQATAGICDAHRNPVTGDPMQLSTNVCDKLTALTASQAVTAALFARERSGRGEHVQLSMLDASIAFQWCDAMWNHVFLDDPPPKMTEIGTGLKPWKTADGFIAATMPQPEEFVAFCKALGREDVALDPRFATTRARTSHVREMRAILEPEVAKHPTTGLLERMRALGAPVGRVHDRIGVIEDPQVVHNRIMVEVDHGELGRVRLPRGPARFGDADSLPGPAPRLGEHTVEVLRELGYDDARIAALIGRGAAGPPSG